MKTNRILVVAVGFVIFSCGSSRDSGKSNDISGAYVRQYSIKVVNTETGGEIGMRTVRDTILIQPVDDGYEVSNRKWKLDDFDKEGWKNMEHSEDRPFPNYQSIFENGDSSLNPIQPGQGISLHIDPSMKTVYKGMDRKGVYEKVQ